MKFFIDTADLDEIRKARQLGLIDGVTTNPSLVAKTGRRYLDVVREICEVVDGPISAEVLSVDVSEARACEGVFAVVTARDVPGENQIGVASLDQPLLVETKARMFADRIALIAADTALGLAWTRLGRAIGSYEGILR